MYFKDVIGQEPLKEKLAKTVRENRISHAWLFFGSEGSGTLPISIAFARYVLCTSRGEIDSCGVCPSCIKVNKYVHPDLHFSFPVNKTRLMDKDSTVSDDFVAEWRNFLLDQPYGRLNQWYDAIDLENKQGIINTEESKRLSAKLNLKSFESEYKVVIIWQPEKMNDQAGNKLLKLMEEPPPMTLFILAGENPDQLLPTIVSRCIQVKVPRIADADMVRVLKNKHGVSEDKAAELVHLASGNYLRILELLAGGEDPGYNSNRFRDLMRLCFMKKIPEMVRISDEFSGLTREKQKSFLEYCLSAVRESLALHFNTPDIVCIPADEQKFFSNFAPYITGENVLCVQDELTRAITDIERNGNGRIIFLDLILKLSALIKK
jgi:DNA polymerase-3 subunit delta'